MKNIEIDNEALMQKVHSYCDGANGEGWPIRGKVHKETCPGCGLSRWDDGTPCRGCGARLRPIKKVERMVF